MRHTKGKKIGLMIFIIAAFLAIPIATAYAQDAMKGDPVIKCVSSELILSEEQVTNIEDASYGDIIFYLEIQLKATRHYASNVNATLRFKDRASLAVEQTMTGEKNDPKILLNQANWNSIERGEAKYSLLPFEITGFQRLPEKMEVELDVTYRNPNDEEIYSTTLSIIPDLPDTTISILSTSFTNPPDKPKGDDIPISFILKNTGSETGYGLSIDVIVKSIGIPNYPTLPYKNDAGIIELRSSVIWIFFDIAPQEEKLVDYDIPCTGYTNGAMNLGKWKIIRVEVYCYNSPSVILYEDHCYIADPYFEVEKKAQGAGPHAVFAYYLWNSGGNGDNWEGANPRNILLNGYGNVKAGLWRFSQSSSNIPELLNIVLATDDGSWNIPSTYHKISELRPHGLAYIEQQLDVENYELYTNDDRTDLYNCGFDIFIMAAGRRGNVAGSRLGNNVVVCKWRPGLPYTDEKWKSNIDGVIQHEVSHIFGCLDVADGHAEISCIMAYWQNWIGWPISYLYEYMTIGTGRQTNNWCTDTGTYGCQTAFTTNWARFYTIWR